MWGCGPGVVLMGPGLLAWVAFPLPAQACAVAWPVCDVPAEHDSTVAGTATGWGKAGTAR